MDEPSGRTASPADDRIDALFARGPEEFVIARDALVKELKATGDKDGAAEVKALRRPTVAAWAVNQVARSAKADLVALIQIGDRLRDAHDALLEGKGDAGVREVTVERRKLVAKLTKQAVAMLGPGGDAQADAITHTFDAAVADPEAGMAVRTGRLSKELAAPSGFGGGLIFGSSEAAPPRPGREERRAFRRSRQATEPPAAAPPKEGERRRRELEREAEEESLEAQRAAREAAAARQEVSRLQDLLVTANARATSAARKAQLAQWNASTAQRAVDDVSDAG